MSQTTAVSYTHLTSLESVSLPANLKTLGASAFSRCLSLEGMEIDQSNKDFVTYDGILYSSDYELAYVVPAGIVGPVRMPEAVTIIPVSYTHLRLLSLQR